MKRAERHHLKDNELANLAVRSRQIVEERKGQLGWVVAALLIVAVAAAGFWVWRRSVEGRAQAMLAEALVTEEATVGPPPDPAAADKAPKPAYPDAKARAQAALTKFKATADQYPSTDAGVYARYREGTTALAVGTPEQAMSAFQSVIDRDARGIYGQMAKLGLAEAQARGGQLDQSIATYKELAEQTDGTLPLDGILMQLGRTYLIAGKSTDAEQTFNRIVQEFPGSQFVAEARQQLDSLKKS
jgi:TolA-binding protein